MTTVIEVSSYQPPDLPLITAGVRGDSLHQDQPGDGRGSAAVTGTSCRLPQRRRVHRGQRATATCIRRERALYAGLRVGG